MQNAAERRCSTIVTVHCAYTSQVDSRNGTLLGHRNGDQFFTFDGMKVQADWNAAANIEARNTDKEITRWMKSSDVLKVLLNRTAAFLEKMGMTLGDAVKSGCGSEKHLKQNNSKKRCIGESSAAGGFPAVSDWRTRRGSTKTLDIRWEILPIVNTTLSIRE